jgi:transposase-like protein
MMIYSEEMKERFLRVFRKTGCHISQACDHCGICRQTYYLWIDKYPEFADAVKEEIERDKDNLEAVLKQVAYVEKNPAVLIWLSKVKLRDRGYIERAEVELKHDITVSLPDDMTEDMS